MMTANERKILETAHANAEATVATQRGRKPMAAAVPVVVDADLTPVAQTVALLDARAERVRAVALQVGYQLPGGGVDADLIQRDIAANMRRSVEACLEVGRGLTALKEACEHGEFGKRLEVLGVETSVARRFMIAAAKFPNRALAHDLTKAIGTQSKLFELLVLDAEEVEELAVGGEVRGLDADDIAGMTRNELRAALKDARAQAGAKDKVLADNSTKINELAQQLELARSEAFVPPPHSVARTKQEQALLSEVFKNSLRIKTRMRSLFVAVDAALNDGGTCATEAIQQAARASVQYLAQQLADMAQEFGIAIDLQDSVDAPWSEADEADLAALERRNASAAE